MLITYCLVRSQTVLSVSYPLCHPPSRRSLSLPFLLFTVSFYGGNGGYPCLCPQISSRNNRDQEEKVKLYPKHTLSMAGNQVRLNFKITASKKEIPSEQSFTFLLQRREALLGAGSLAGSAGIASGGERGPKEERGSLWQWGGLQAKRKLKKKKKKKKNSAVSHYTSLSKRKTQCTVAG